MRRHLTHPLARRVLVRRGVPSCRDIDPMRTRSVPDPKQAASLGVVTASRWHSLPVQETPCRRPLPPVEVVRSAVLCFAVREGLEKFDIEHLDVEKFDIKGLIPSRHNGIRSFGHSKRPGTIGRRTPVRESHMDPNGSTFVDVVSCSVIAPRPGIDSPGPTPNQPAGHVQASACAVHTPTRHNHTHPVVRGPHRGAQRQNEVATHG